jgi:hypothetical protein
LNRREDRVVEVQVRQRLRRLHDRKLQWDGHDLRGRSLVTTLVLHCVVDLPEYPLGLLGGLRPEEEEHIRPVDLAVQLLLPSIAGIEAEYILEDLNAHAPQGLDSAQDLSSIGRGIRDEGAVIAMGCARGRRVGVGISQVWPP